MIKTFCDRCGAETTKQVYGNHLEVIHVAQTAIERDTVVPETIDKDLCDNCAHALAKFLAGQKLKGD